MIFTSDVLAGLAFPGICWGLPGRPGTHFDWYSSGFSFGFLS
jgi:hypothetical protein